MKLNIFALIVVGFCYMIASTNADIQFTENNSSKIDKKSNNNDTSLFKNNLFSATSNLFQSFYEKLSTVFFNLVL